MDERYKEALVKMTKRKNELEKALQFYARKGNYAYSPIDDNIPEVNKDGGEIARKTLGY